MRLLLTVLALFGWAFSSHAATYYVDWNNGSDVQERDGSNGTTQSWKSLSYACSRVSGPDTIHINPSLRYLDTGRCFLAPGVTIEGAGPETTRITARFPVGDGSGYIFREQTGQAVHRGNNEISGFTLDGDDRVLGTGIWLKGYDNINIHHMKFQHIKSHAIVLAGYNGWRSYEAGMVTPPAAYGYHNSIHDVKIEDCTSRSSVKHDDRFGAIDLEGLADSQFYNITIDENYPEHGTGIKAVPGWLSNVKFYNNTIATNEPDPDAFAMEVYNFVKGAEIHGNKFRHILSLNGGPLLPAGTWNLKIHDNDFKLVDGNQGGNEFSHNNVDIYRNYFHDGGIPAAGIWTTNGLTGGSVRNWRFHHNVVYNASNGIFIGKQSGNSGSNNIEIYNNVFDTMTGKPWGGYGVNGEALAGSCHGVTVSNNIFVNCAAGPANFTEGFADVTFDYNLLHANGNENRIMGGSPGKNNKISVPGYAGASSPGLPRPHAYYAPSGKTSNLYRAGNHLGSAAKSERPHIGPYDVAGESLGTKAPVSRTPAGKPPRQRSTP